MFLFNYFYLGYYFDLNLFYLITSTQKLQNDASWYVNELHCYDNASTVSIHIVGT